MRSLRGGLSGLESARLVGVFGNRGAGAEIDLNGDRSFQWLHDVRGDDGWIACSASYAGRKSRDSISRKRAIRRPAEYTFSSFFSFPSGNPNQQPKTTQSQTTAAASRKLTCTSHPHQ